MQQTRSQSMKDVKVCVTYSSPSLNHPSQAKQFCWRIGRFTYDCIGSSTGWFCQRLYFSSWGECVLAISFLAMDTNPHTLGKACCAWCIWEINWLSKRYGMMNLRDQHRSTYQLPLCLLTSSHIIQTMYVCENVRICFAECWECCRIKHSWPGAAYKSHVAN